MARNVQIWTHDYRLLLDGPRAKRSRPAARRPRPGRRAGISATASSSRRCRSAGTRSSGSGRWWPAWRRHRASRKSLPDAPLGYLTAYPADRPRPGAAGRALAAAAGPRAATWRPSAAFDRAHDHRCRQTMPQRPQVAWTPGTCWASSRCRGVSPGTCSRCPSKSRSSDWLDAAAARRIDRAKTAAAPAGRSAAELASASSCGRATGPAPARPRPSLTFATHGPASFEVAYWKTIAMLATGQLHEQGQRRLRAAIRSTQSLLAHQQRDLDALGDYLLDYYRPDDRPAGHDRQGPGRRAALPLADRFRFPLAGRLEGEPGRHAAANGT